MKEIIYYERDENKRPVKRVGRELATERVRKAMRCSISESDWSDTDPWKAVFDPTLTPYEQTLIAKSV
ncbi:hypothetical protein LCGC14_1475300 [marine sediment metagenome]|uniref:Uncharacterized protein n=1 Tax=marine sediment metagenome TaxID=412755 RepID=A0A0F9JB37_9ZZZZ